MLQHDQQGGSTLIMKKRFFSLLTILAVVMTLVVSYAITDDNVYAASTSKKYYLPKEANIVQYGTDGFTRWYSDITYDKYGNLTSAMESDMIPLKYTIKYKDKKGAISRVTYGDGESSAHKYYDNKGRLTKVTCGGKTYKYSKSKKGTISKVTLDGKEYYSVKSIQYHKNGFVSRIVYSNGNVNKYNSSGLMTYAKVKNGPKYTYEYTKKNGKIVKVLVKRDGKKYRKVTYKYGKASTNNVWKYSCIICFTGGPSNATELYANSSVSGSNAW